ncbi:MAG: hypothetical protein CVV22_04780 [Ignavibacteriae bacterium HGW-Ignavibacteriae-1]|jgi:hypothetical protein|nr:MAG: hypothetical protein CVV22_04780 [Ignavibacteriae bacterium HGW-Ignavibacteriae-1]
MKKLSLFSLFIFVLALGCSDDSNSPNNNSKELMPLKIGNSWVYNYTYYDGFAEHSGKVTSTVISDEMYNGEKYYRIETLNHINNQKKISPIYSINKTDGLYMLYFEDNDELHTDFLKYPVSEGEIFQSNESSKLYVEKVDTLISTSAGKFNCIKYIKKIIFDGKEIDISIMYYCPGIGRIAGEYFLMSDETRNPVFLYKSELVSYNLK